MANAEKFTTIGWLLIFSLISGFGMALGGKPLHASFAILHKLSAVVCLVFIVLRISTAFRLFASRPAILTLVVIFAVAFLAACVTGSIESIPSQAGPLWLNLHRTAWIIALAACGVAGRLMMVSR
jgi:uncharacterized membrane protein YadS